MEDSVPSRCYNNVTVETLVISVENGNGNGIEEIKNNNNETKEIKVNQPKDNWEVAYVYAFLLKFTDLQSTTAVTSLLFNALTLEEELLSSSPPNSNALTPTEATQVTESEPVATTSTSTSASNLVSSASGTPIHDLSSPSSSTPPPSALIVQIIETLQYHLPNSFPSNHKLKKGWFPWIFNWIKIRLQERHAGGLRWWYEGRGNLLKKVGVKSGKESEEAFWELEWEDKIHLIRVLVDWALTYSPTIRSEITEAFDIGHQRTLKRTPDLNSLVIEPVGQLAGKTLWHLGNQEGRLYLCGEGEGEFESVAGTRDEFKAYFEGLQQAEVDEDEELAKEEELKPKSKIAALTVSGDPFSKAREAAKKRKAAEKAKLKNVISPEALEEMEMRKLLEERFKGVEKGEANLLALTVKKLRAIERAEQKVSGSTSSRSIDREAFMYRPSSRSTRFRNQTTKIDYVYPSPLRKPSIRYRSETPDEILVDAGDEDESVGSESDDEGWNGKGKGKGKKNRKDKSFAADGDDLNDGGEDSDDSTTTRKKKRKYDDDDVPEWKGERRSSRHQKLEEDNDVEMDSAVQEDQIALLVAKAILPTVEIIESKEMSTDVAPEVTEKLVKNGD